ncbi:polysaccharide deacetylase [Geobacter pelophilus]|uniref:Polysaccharide deacetylase n=1 Tax=Geoanaerobacter pelophilus TaxID=60036 RepID=A0AAW4L722_9BACT|nr:polysaccharide deacetylase [Geoanaerobacter pelophilus]MBT0665352.1 polysaccharide deacetylase [Geoanaerobacter pelophilus]
MSWRKLLQLNVLLLLALFAIPTSPLASTITGYQPVVINYLDSSGARQLAIRSFSKAGTPYYLVVDQDTLATKLAPATSVKPATAEATPFDDILAKKTAPPYSLQNFGLKHAIRPVSGMFLSVDLCPSKRPFEKGMFEALTAISRTSGRPTPVAICISGAWLSTHREELSWLKDQEQKGLLAITWVNHSLSHFYDPALLLERNFMLAAGTNQRMEILANEVAMLEAGITPSPFFRFPGLVSDERLAKLLRELSLIPLGADAWLAKGEAPRDGSIILVHGNGNEPPGIVKLMKLLQSSNSPHFLPLTAATTASRNNLLDKAATAGQR